MKDGYLKIVLEALAEKIDRLNGEVYVKNLQHNEMELAIAELKKELVRVNEENKRLWLKRENETLTMAAHNLKQALVGEENHD